MNAIGATGLARAKFRTKPGPPPGIAKLQLGPPNRKNAEPKLGDLRNSRATARDPCDGMGWDATIAMECDVTKN